MSSVFERFDHGPVTFYRMTRKVPGSRPMRVGIYVVDGVMIDTGPRRSREAVAAILQEVPIKQVLLTHHHEDHVGNAAFVAGELGIRPWIHPVGQPLAANPERLPLYRRLYWGQHAAVETQPLGDTFETDNYSFRVIHTPGHAPDHIVLHEPSQNWLFGGDLYLTDRVVRARAGTCRLRTVLPAHRSAHEPSEPDRQEARSPARPPQQGDRAPGGGALRSIREIASALGIPDKAHKWLSGGEWSSEHLVRGLLRDAGRLD